MRRTGTFCEDCGTELELLMHGGQEPDPGRPGKYRAATTAELRCPTAFQDFKAEEARVLREVRSRYRDHLRLVRVQWPPTGAPAKQERLPLGESPFDSDDRIVGALKGRLIAEGPTL